MAILIRNWKTCSKLYHNRLSFVEDVTKHFGVFFGSQS